VADLADAAWEAHESGVIAPQAVAEGLEISLSHARNFPKEVETQKQSVQGRFGVSCTDLTDSLCRGSAAGVRRRRGVAGVLIGW
jgi:hypothetical protein